MGDNHLADVSACYALFKAGDVVHPNEGTLAYDQTAATLGLVIELAAPDVRVAWEDGSWTFARYSAFKHREPRTNVPVPPEAIGLTTYEARERQRAVAAALRLAGIREPRD